VVPLGDGVAAVQNISPSTTTVPFTDSATTIPEPYMAIHNFSQLLMVIFHNDDMIIQLIFHNMKSLIVVLFSCRDQSHVILLLNFCTAFCTALDDCLCR
jgi:hypothetical protein